MKKMYILALGAIGFSSMTIAQNSNSLRDLNNINYQETTPQKSLKAVNVSRATQNCVDTVDYALYSALDQTNAVTYATVTLEDSASSIGGMGIFFPVPAGQSVTLNGMEFYAYGLKPNGTASQAIVSVYLAGADSTPTGNALVTKMVSVGTNDSLISDLYKVTSFAATTVSSSFVVTVEAGSPTDSLVQLTGGATSFGGQFDGFPTNLAVGGNWVRLAGTSVLGVIVPRIHPIVSYDATNSISANITKLTMANEVVNFTTTSPTIGETYISFTGSGFVASTNTSSIDFGDGNAINGSPQAPSNTYVDETQNYTVVLTDTIILYQNNVQMCTISESLTIQKADPNGIADIDSGKFFAYSSQNEIVIGNGVGNATLYSITGLVVKRAVITSQLEKINVSDLSTGVYILQVDNKIVKLNL